MLLGAELLLFILSWLLSATRMEGVRSLLSSEGIRWFFGSFTEMVASPLLVWLLLGLIAYGCLNRSGLLSITKSQFTISYRQRVALRVALVFMFIYVVMIALLTLMPHAILLSATGSLFPSAFSRSLIPILAFGICLVSISYGLVSGHLSGLGDVLSALSCGIAGGASIIILYLLFIQFYESLRFVFGFV
ncbi:MAG: AbgT family transporter [Prevotella sp.]|nr:AbgT family transporter [Prevotella sp.]